MIWPLYFWNLPHPQNQPGHLPPPEIELRIPFTILTEIPSMGTYWGEVNGTQDFGVENLKNLEDLGVDG
jgi:hypothetical protein